MSSLDLQIARESADEGGIAPSHRYFAAAAIMLGILMGSLDSSIVNVALPTVAAALHVESASVIWVTNGYQVASAIFMLIFSALGRVLGQRFVYVAGLALFTLASLGCAVSGSLGLLVAMRVLQGIGYAAMVTIGLGLYRVIFPPRSLSTVLGWNALVVSFGMAVGPVVGGVLVAFLSWPWLFLINLPLGLIGFFYARRSLPRDSGMTSGFDLLGALVSGLAICALVTGVDQIGRWQAGMLSAVFVASGVLVAVFVYWQTRAAIPLVPLDIFRSRRFSMAVLASVSMFTAQGLAMVALPFLLQHSYGYSVLQSALIFTPWPLAVVVVAPMAGKLAGRVNGTLLSSLGVIVMAAGLALIAWMPSPATVETILWRVCLCGVGYGLFLPPNNSEMLSNVPKMHSSIASGVLSTAKTVGQSLGAALVAMVLALLVVDTGVGAPSTAFTRLAFGSAAAVALLSSLVSVARVHR